MKLNSPAGPVRTSSYFDKVVDAYSSWYGEASAGGYALRERQGRALDLLDRRPGKVLDVGCGPGILARELLPFGHEVWGIDASAGMIAQCQRAFAETDRAHFEVGDANHLAFPDASFDAVVSTGVIDFVSTPEAAIREMARVTSPDGTLIISFPNLASPYAAWLKFVYHPAVAVLRPIVYQLAGRPQPASLPLYRNRLYTMRQATALLARHGVDVTAVVYYYFNPCLAPLDLLAPRFTLAATERLGALYLGPLRWLGAGFLVRGRKRS